MPTAAQIVAGRARSLAHQDVGDRAHDRAPYIVAIDGRSGSGKTTVGGAVAHLLGDAPVIHMDDLYDGWQGAEAGSRLLVRDLLEPIRRGERASYHRFDWESGAYEPHVIEVPTHEFLVVEGVLAMWGPARSLVDLAVWLEAPVQVRKDRALRRDGGVFAPHWAEWTRAENRLFAADDTASKADLVLSTAAEPVDKDMPLDKDAPLEK